eukprot:92914-Hanusia_phi.AAC.1
MNCRYEGQRAVAMAATILVAMIAAALVGRTGGGGGEGERKEHAATGWSRGPAAHRWTFSQEQQTAA